MSELTVQQRVQNGIDRLNEYRPNWHKSVTPEHIAMDDSCDCVIGQLFGRWSKWCQLMHVESSWRLGFDAKGGLNCEDTSDDFAALEAEWVRRIGELNS